MFARPNTEQLDDNERLSLRLAWLGQTDSDALSACELTQIAFDQAMESAMAKLGVASATEAVVAALRLNLIFNKDALVS